MNLKRNDLVMINQDGPYKGSLGVFVCLYPYTGEEATPIIFTDGRNNYEGSQCFVHRIASIDRENEVIEYDKVLVWLSEVVKIENLTIRDLMGTDDPMEIIHGAQKAAESKAPEQKNTSKRFTINIGSDLQRIASYIKADTTIVQDEKLMFDFISDGSDSGTLVIQADPEKNMSSVDVTDLYKQFNFTDEFLFENGIRAVSVSSDNGELLTILDPVELERLEASMHKFLVYRAIAVREIGPDAAVTFETYLGIAYNEYSDNINDGAVLCAVAVSMTCDDGNIDDMALFDIGEEILQSVKNRNISILGIATETYSHHSDMVADMYARCRIPYSDGYAYYINPRIEDVPDDAEYKTVAEFDTEDHIWRGIVIRGTNIPVAILAVPVEGKDGDVYDISNLITKIGKVQEGVSQTFLNSTFAGAIENLTDMYLDRFWMVINGDNS